MRGNTTLDLDFLNNHKVKNKLSISDRDYFHSAWGLSIMDSEYYTSKQVEGAYKVKAKVYVLLGVQGTHIAAE